MIKRKKSVRADTQPPVFARLAFKSPCKNRDKLIAYTSCYVALFLFIKLTITLVMVFFSSGLLTAIIKVKATSALSGIRLSPVLVNSRLFFSRKSKNRYAAIRLLWKDFHNKRYVEKMIMQRILFKSSLNQIITSCF